MPTRRSLSYLKGFTLLELVVTMVVISILAGVLGPFLYQSVESVTAAYNTKALSSQGRITLELMAQDIRNTRSASSGPELTVGTNSITVSTLGDKTIAYSLSGSDIIKTVNGTASTMASDVTSLNYTYYAIGGTTTSTASLVRYVKMSFTMAKNGETQNFNMIVNLRNA